MTGADGAAGPAGPAGSTLFSGLTDKTTADLPAINGPLNVALGGKATLQVGALAASTTQAPNATGVLNAIAAVSIAPASLSYRTAIELDSVVGKDAGLHVLTAADNFTIASSPAPVLNGAFLLELQLTGSFVPTFAAGISVQGDPITAEDGRIYEIAFVKRPSGPVAVATKTAFIADTTAPVIGTPHVENANAAKILFPITEPNSPTLNGTTAGVTLAGAGLGGRTCTAVAVVAGNVEVTLSSAMAWNSVITCALAAGMVKDASNNQSASKTATTVINNLPFPAPGVPTSITQGTPTSASVPLSWTAPVVDVTHGTPVTYQAQVRLHAGPGAWSNYGSAVSHPTVAVNPSGLTASTAYDFQVEAINAAGNSGFAAGPSNVSTAASGGAAGATLTETATDGSLTLAMDGFADWQMFAPSNFNHQKTDAPFGTPIALIPTSVLSNHDTGADSTFGQAVSYTNSDEGSHSYSSGRYHAAVGGTLSRKWTGIPASALQNTVRIGYLCRRYAWGDTSSHVGLKFTVHAADASFADVVQEVSHTGVADYGYEVGEVTITFKTGGASTIDLTMTPSDDGVAAGAVGYFGVQYITLDQNT